MGDIYKSKDEQIARFKSMVTDDGLGLSTEGVLKIIGFYEQERDEVKKAQKEIGALRAALKTIAEPLRFTKKEADNIEWLKLALSEMQNISRKALEGGETHSVRIKESGEVTIPYGHTLKDNGDGTFTVEPIKNLDGVNKDGV